MEVDNDYHLPPSPVGASRIDQIDESLRNIEGVLSHRGLERQFSFSCTDTLSQLLAEVEGHISVLGLGEDSGGLQRRLEASKEHILRLMSAQHCHAPPNRIGRSISRSLSLDTGKAEIRSSPAVKRADMTMSTVAMEIDTPDTPTPGLASPSTPEVYSWGRSDFGALLHPDLLPHPNINTPVQMQTHSALMEISSNFYHTAVITTTGELLTCGYEVLHPFAVSTSLITGSIYS